MGNASTCVFMNRNLKASGCSSAKLDERHPHFRQPLDRVGDLAGPVEGLAKLHELAFDQFAEQGFLIGEVEVDRRCRVVDLGRQLPHREAVKAVGQQQFPPGLEQSLAGLGFAEFAGGLGGHGGNPWRLT